MIPTLIGGNLYRRLHISSIFRFYLLHPGTSLIVASWSSTLSLSSGEPFYCSAKYSIIRALDLRGYCSLLHQNPRKKSISKRMANKDRRKQSVLLFTYDRCKLMSHCAKDFGTILIVLISSVRCTMSYQVVMDHY